MSTKIIWLICLSILALFVIFDLLHHDYKSAVIVLLTFVAGFTISKLLTRLK